MKQLTLILAIILSAAPAWAIGGSGGGGQSSAYTQLKSNVNSTTVPVEVLAPGTKGSWMCELEAASAENAQCDFYSGTVPGSISANSFEITPSKSASDGLWPNNTALGIACVCESTCSSAIVMDCVSRN